MASVAASIGISLAVSAATAGLTYALTPTQKLSQGRLDSLISSTSSYGQPIPWAWGTVRLPGNRIWQTYLEETRKKKRQGKGSKVETSEYKYFGYYATMFCECPFRPVVDFQRIWMNKKLVYSTIGGASTITEGGKFADQYLRFYKGEAAQYIDPLLQNTEPISNFTYGLPVAKAERDAFLRSLGIDPQAAVLTNAHNYKAYMVAQRLPLNDFFNAIPSTNEAEIVASENCTVGQIIGDIMSLFYEPSRYDVSLLTDTVAGFAIDTVGAAKNTIQLLQQAYFFDYVYSNGVYKFIPLKHPRDIVNLNPGSLAATIAGNKKPIDYEIIEKDPSTLPSKVIVKYIDKDLDYDVNEQSSEVEVKAHYNSNPTTLTFNIVMSASQAATLADRALTLAWAQKYLYKFQLPPAYLHLEPSDLIFNLFDDRAQAIKITQTRIGANLIIDCEGVAHDTYFWNLVRVLEQGGVTIGVADYSVVIEVDGEINTVADISGNIYTEGTDYIVNGDGNIQVLSSGTIEQGTDLVVSTTTVATQQDFGSIVSSGDTELLILDIPLIADSEEDYTLYLAAGGGENWSGASIYVSTDDSRYSFVFSTTISSIYGTTTTAFDVDGSITVAVNQSELESITDSDLDLGFNLALVGNEIIQFKTAQLTDVNTYILSDITRGLRGTEAIADPAVGDRFVLLRGDNANLSKLEYTAADLNQTRYFKAVSSGQSLDEVEPIQITIQGLAQRPYAPVNITATKNGVGDITIEWDRRDRHDSKIPPTVLSEELEQYVVEVFNGNDQTRSLSTNNSSAIYTAENQADDFSALVSTITVSIAQVSSSYGSGKPKIQELTPVYFEPPPTIISFNPKSATVGTTIYVTGYNLASVESVLVGDVLQSNLATIDNEQISFVLQPGSVTNAIEVVTAGGGTDTAKEVLIVPHTQIEFLEVNESRTLLFSDNSKIIDCNSNDDITLTLDERSIASGFQTTVRKVGQGNVLLQTFDPESTLQAKGTVLRSRYSVVYVAYKGDGIWVAFGDLE